MKTSIKISFLFVLLVSCNNIKSPAITPTPESYCMETPSPQSATRQNEIKVIWESGSHAQATKPVKCEACHKVRDSVVLENIELQNQPTNPVDSANANSLCGQCHEETIGGNVHPGFTCIGCHDPHSTTASCTASGCHPTMQGVVYEVPPTPTGGHPKTGSSFCGGANCHPAATAVADSAVSVHGSSHARVSCEACHAASGLQAGPSPDGSAWVLLREIDTNGGGALESAFSHDIQREVNCTACHFENNLWGLKLVSGDEFVK
jgi:hypothetical protein